MTVDIVIVDVEVGSCIYNIYIYVYICVNVYSFWVERMSCFFAEVQRVKALKSTAKKRRETDKKTGDAMQRSINELKLTKVNAAET